MRNNITHKQVKFIRLFSVKIFPLLLALLFASSIYLMFSDNEQDTALIGFVGTSFSIICFCLIWVISVLTNHILNKKY